MAEAFDYSDIFTLTVDSSNSRSLAPGERWNTFLNAHRGSESTLSALGSLVGMTAGVDIHAGMIEFCAENFANAAQPPFTYSEQKAFMDGAMAQLPVILNLDMARGGQLQ
jgi:hypothetical protein